MAWASLSIGVVPLTATSGRMPEVLSAADSACYVAKERGRDRIHLDLPENPELSRRHGEMRWVARLGEAIDQGHLRLYRQKIIPLSPTGTSGDHYELLLRLEERDGTLITPGTFLPPAEQYNVSTRLDRWVVHHALEWMSDVATELEMCFTRQWSARSKTGNRS